MSEAYIHVKHCATDDSLPLITRGNEAWPFFGPKTGGVSSAFKLPTESDDTEEWMVALKEGYGLINAKVPEWESE